MKKVFMVVVMLMVVFNVALAMADCANDQNICLSYCRNNDQNCRARCITTGSVCLMGERNAAIDQTMDKVNDEIQRALNKSNSNSGSDDNN